MKQPIPTYIVDDNDQAFKDLLDEGRKREEAGELHPDFEKWLEEQEKVS